MTFDLRAAARKALADNGFVADFPPAVLSEVQQLGDPAKSERIEVRDLKALPWSSIDNDSSKDLDQVEVAETLPNGDVRVRVGIADVDALVPLGSQTDKFAQANSTSVYTGVVTFPMLPERLSTDLTSLRQDVERPVVVIEFTVSADG
ncbi:MAG TPA: ribonuclease catalytic domain-containing protein, partial [Gemmatimonadaceae bacterium]|nr:ribonuclease catalytic domain-containing protein [Gemmatimonadaceae bacterium]